MGYYLPPVPGCGEVDPCGCTSSPCTNPCNTPSAQSDNLAYTGPTLSCIDVDPCDSLTVVIQKINAAICEINEIIGNTTTTTTTTGLTTTTTSSTTSTTTTVVPVTTTTSTTILTTTTTSTTQDPLKSYCLYWDDTNLSTRMASGYSDVVLINTSLLGQYIDSRDNVIYGGDTTLYTNTQTVTWNTNRTGWYVEFTVGGITYGPYVYDIIFDTGVYLPAGMMAVDESNIRYNPPSSIDLFGTVRFNTVSYYGAINANIASIGPGDGMRIYKANCSQLLI